MDPPQCVEELEDDVFQPEDELGTQPGSLPSADLFAQSQLDCPLSRLQLFPLTHCCGPGLRPTSQEDKATQTLSPASPSQGVMLPCGVTEEPQRLFYGNAGYRLPLPASFPAGLPLGEQPPEGQWQHRAEIQIARKLQCIADQFHRLHMQQHQQNRNRMWWQILLFLHNLALNGNENRNGAGPSFCGSGVPRSGSPRWQRVERLVLRWRFLERPFRLHEIICASSVRGHVQGQREMYMVIQCSRRSPALHSVDMRCLL
ncbi:bcl-2-modifying factor isoform 1-T4 [Glossophaga mutica]